MATTISWGGGDDAFPIVPAESGANDTLGFFGAGFGFSIRVGEWNNTNYVTDNNGTVSFGQVPNLRWANVSGSYVGSDLVARELLEIDNTEATLRIVLSTDSAVSTQNTSFRAFDRLNIASAPSGVTVRAAEIIKPELIRGSGDVNWSTIAGTTSLSLGDQVAPSSVHEWFIGITVSPDSIGEKTDFGLYYESEFI